MPKIYLYAEALTHLRQLTLHASLRTEKNEETRIDISSDKKIITVIHDGESSSLYLPTQISGTARVTFPLDKKTEVSARVQIDDLEQWKETDAAGIEAPWNASELSVDTAMNCLQCDCEIVSAGAISSWKDLPNQHWADIMDLWFCHKPHEQDDGKHEQSAAKAKGFSAYSKLASQSGVGLVDLVSFAVHPDDCNIEKNLDPKFENTLKAIPVHCTQCQSQIGVFSNHDNLVRLDKSSLSVKPKQGVPSIAFPPATFVAAQLLELIESTAIRRFVVYDQTYELGDSEIEKGMVDLKLESSSGDQSRGDTQSNTEKKSVPPLNSPLSRTDTPETQDQGPHPTTKTQPSPQPLLLWVFNPDIYYSSSHLTTSPGPDNSTTSSSSSTSNKNSPASPNLASTSSTPTPTTSSTLLPHRALKIFYQPLPAFSLIPYLSSTQTNINPQTHEHNPTAHEPLPLPPSTLNSLHNALQTSTTLLPPSARNFQTYQIGLLDRYERNPTASKILESNPLARKLSGSEIAADGNPRITRWELPAGAAELFL